MTRYLIINADDFGLHGAVNHAVADCFRAGNLTSATLLVNAPATEEAAELAHSLPGLGVGLHFNLSQGRPLSDAAIDSGLADRSGQFRSRNATLARVYRSPAARKALGAELQAQYRRMRALGLSPTHIDSHQHVHAAAPVFATLAEFCIAHDLPLRIPWVEKPLGKQAAAKRLRRAALQVLLGRSTAPFENRLRANDAIASVFDLGMIPDQFEDQHYARLLQGRSGSVLELMVHPANSASSMQGATRIGTTSEAEWRYLRSGNLPALARAAGYSLSDYRAARINRSRR